LSGADFDGDEAMLIEDVALWPIGLVKCSLILSLAKMPGIGKLSLNWAAF